MTVGQMVFDQKTPHLNNLCRSKLELNFSSKMASLKVTSAKGRAILPLKRVFARLNVNQDKKLMAQN
jgi:hypothetical protein